jgi:hypothetical protein
MKLPVKYSETHFTIRKQIREEYIRIQNGLCFYCKHPLCEQPPSFITSKRIDWKLFPENFLKYPVHLQHCHKTDYTEGAVHAYCNAVMWYYEGR